MANEIIQKIDKLLADRGESRAAASAAAGLSDSYIRDLSRKSGSPNVGKLKKLADHLGVKIEYLLPAGSVDTNISRSVTSLPVVGRIAAGQFMDISLRDQDEEYPHINVVTDDRFSHARQYALEVTGDSMDLKYADGSFVTCVDYTSSGLALKDGMTVHVERYMGEGQFVETTLKEIGHEHGIIVLLPRSSNLAHKPILMVGNAEEITVEIRGIVTGSWKPEVF
jgi:SOS-response transcriptional repressor LexA